MCDQKIANDNGENEKAILASISNNLQIFEIKQLADKEALYKENCKKAIRDYRHWQKTQEDQTDMIEILYSGMEGRMYRDQAMNAIQLYWAIRAHFRTAFQIYLNNVGVYKTPYKQAA